MWLIKPCFDAFIEPGTKYRQALRWCFNWLSKCIYFLMLPIKIAWIKIIITYQMYDLSSHNKTIAIFAQERKKNQASPPSESNPQVFLLSGPHSSLYPPCFDSPCQVGSHPSVITVLYLRWGQHQHCDNWTRAARHI